MKMFEQQTETSSSAELTEEAWIWLRKLHSGKFTEWDEKAFRRWLQHSQAHQNAFSEARHQWDLLKPAAAGSMLRGQTVSPSGEKTVNIHRRVFLGSAAGAAIAGIVALEFPSSRILFAPREWDADYRTATGEQQTVTLENQVFITLNTQTSVRKLAEENRLSGVTLLSGEIAVDLTGDSPFIVAAGAGKSTAITPGRLEVRQLDDKICVTCIQGRLQVSHPAGLRELQSQQQILYSQADISGIVSISPKEISAWRKGELVFNQTPLAEVITEINRYRPGRVVLMNESAGRERVSGSFNITQLESALRQLQKTFDLRGRVLPAGIYILS